MEELYCTTNFRRCSFLPINRKGMNKFKLSLKLLRLRANIAKESLKVSTKHNLVHYGPPPEVLLGDWKCWEYQVSRDPVLL